MASYVAPLAPRGPPPTATAPSYDAANASTSAKGTNVDRISSMDVAAVPKAGRRYRWHTGDCLATYGTSANTWRAYSSTEEFAAAFRVIVDDDTLTNDTRATRIEDFLLDQASTAGVVDVLPTRRAVTNPNKWDKHLGPWFTANCAATRRELRTAKRKFGKDSAQTRNALSAFV